MTGEPRTTPNGKRSLPEHTVDCWVASAVTAAYPEALLWAPTQRGDDNWDIAFSAAGPGKALILENKGTQSGLKNEDDHIISIDIRQLRRYLSEPGAPVYYVLPSPPWPAGQSTAQLSTSAPVPLAAMCRTGASCSCDPAHPPFPQWTYVVEATDLAQASFMRPLLVQQRNVLASCVEGLATAVRLSAFLQGIGDCTHGGPRYESGEAARAKWDLAFEQRSQTLRFPPPTDVASRTTRAGSGVLAVFVPIS